LLFISCRGKRLLGLENVHSSREEPAISVDPSVILLRQLPVEPDGVDRASGYAGLAIDAGIRVDHQHGRVVDLVEAEDWAH
jgi:hypothetical protein